MVPITFIKPFDIPPQLQTYPESQTDKQKVLELEPFSKPEIAKQKRECFQPKECIFSPAT